MKQSIHQVGFDSSLKVNIPWNLAKKIQVKIKKLHDQYLFHPWVITKSLTGRRSKNCLNPSLIEIESKANQIWLIQYTITHEVAAFMESVSVNISLYQANVALM